MADFPHMDWYCRDYIADTRHLTPEQKGAYADLLNYAWLNKAQLVDNDAELARMCGFTLRRWLEKIRPAMERLWTIEDGAWFQKRQQNEFRLCAEKVTKNRSNAALGGKAKALNANKSRLANASQTLEPKAAITEADTDSESVRESPLLSPQGDQKLAKRPSKRKSLWPKDLTLTPELRDYAEMKAPGCDAPAMWDQFENHHRAKGSMFVDWDRAWFTWVNSPYEKPMNGNGAIHERTCAVSGRPNQPGGPNKKPGSFVEASRQVLALRSRQS
jgi:uncharacterized protein YdaU (DUF1376 family)